MIYTLPTLLNPSAGPYCNVQDKAYGRAALVAGEEDTEDVMRRFRAVQEKIGEILEGVDAKPSLLHGDLWIGDLSHASPPPLPPPHPLPVTEIDAPHLT